MTKNDTTDTNTTLNYGKHEIRIKKYIAYEYATLYLHGI